MSEPGADCPNCGAKLGESGCLQCYWQPSTIGDSTTCAVCKREKDGKAWCVNRCRRCGNHSPSTKSFHEDGHPDDRGVRLCPSCWIPALKRRMEYDILVNGGRCTLPGCTKTAQEHIEEFRVLVAKLRFMAVKL